MQSAILSLLEALPFRQQWLWLHSLG